MRFFAPLNQDLIPALQAIEVSTSFQIPYFQIVGLPSPEISEARERIRAAVEASGFEFPRKRVILNLSPASIRKRGTGLDLAMALGVLASGHPQSEDRAASWGELGLDGTLKASGQTLRTLYSSWARRIPHLIVSREDHDEIIKWIPYLKDSEIFLGPAPHIHPVRNLREAWEVCERIGSGAEFERVIYHNPPHQFACNDAAGLLPLPPSLERMIGIAASGFHHLLILGPKGVGKSRVLDWLAQLLPPMDAKTQLDHRLLLELTQADSKAGPLGLPVRKISTQAKPAALLGGTKTGAVPMLRPGEFSLAHGGLLIADELPEWARDARESLREPLETGAITLNRAEGSTVLPAHFAFAATGNLCPCGGWPRDLPCPDDSGHGSDLGPCSCSPGQRRAYLRRLSGPILDRIDLIRIVASTRTRGQDPDHLSLMRERVRKTREKLISTWGATSGKLTPSLLEEILSRNRSLLHYLESNPAPNLRSRHKLLRLALSIAAWDNKSDPGIPHLIEARSYRPERLGFLDGSAE